MKVENKTNLFEDEKWKNDNKKYLFEVQKFLDLTDNIQDEKLRKRIINQMLKCDKCLTNIAEDVFKDILKNKHSGE